MSIGAITMMGLGCLVVFSGLFLSVVVAVVKDNKNK